MKFGLTIIVVIFSLLLLLNCSENTKDSTIIKARILKDGKPYKGLKVLYMVIDESKESRKKLKKQLLSTSSNEKKRQFYENFISENNQTVITDDQGYVTLHLKKPGYYSVFPKKIFFEKKDQNEIVNITQNFMDKKFKEFHVKAQRGKVNFVKRSIKLATRIKVLSPKNCQKFKNLKNITFKWEKYPKAQFYQLMIYKEEESKRYINITNLRKNQISLSEIQAITLLSKEQNNPANIREKLKTPGLIKMEEKKFIPGIYTISITAFAPIKKYIKTRKLDDYILSVHSKDRHSGRNKFIFK